MKLHVMLEMGPPPADKRPQEKPEPVSSIEDDVKEAIECIESGHDSHVEWKMLNGVYKELRKREDQKKNKRVANLIKMIEPILSKYGLHGVAEEEK